jgi:Spy/CpxP family protein refolding chaperone
MKKILFIIASVLAIAVLLVPIANAQEKEKPCCPMQQKLNLTEDQQKQIDKSKLEMEKAILPLETQLEVKEAELKSLLIADNPNTAAINAKLDEIGAARTQIQKKRVAHELDVRKLLTPEQRIDFDKRVLKGFDRMEMCRKQGPEMRQHVKMFMEKRLGEPMPCKEKEKVEKIEPKKE